MQALQRAFPAALFGTYGAETKLSVYTKVATAGAGAASLPNADLGSSVYTGQVSEEAKAAIVSNIASASAALIQAVDFHAVVSYDYFSPGTLQAWEKEDPRTALVPYNRREVVRLEVPRHIHCT